MYKSYYLSALFSRNINAYAVCGVIGKELGLREGECLEEEAEIWKIDSCTIIQY